MEKDPGWPVADYPAPPSRCRPILGLSHRHRDRGATVHRAWILGIHLPDLTVGHLRFRRFHTFEKILHFRLTAAFMNYDRAERIADIKRASASSRTAKKTRPASIAVLLSPCSAAAWY